ncbi:MAG: ribosome biogenesis GTP-binding protein YihA/YsxC [bacterium]
MQINTKNIRFLKAVYSLKELPPSKLPEIILCGRSNVGKSSFLNSVFSNKSLAKTSSTPGKTRSLNYYIYGDSAYFVDLPGFGYAKVSKTEREKWQLLIEQFLNSDRRIISTIHLIDSRHQPTELDHLLRQYISERNLPYTVVLNKIDKLKQSEISAVKKNIFGIFTELEFEKNLFLYSSVKGTGKKQMLSFFQQLLNQ